ncbi:MAG TPA: RcpC/CpaB family pilus assembly protein [Acidimicrobiales bacterium]|nr:RcpC/CpaB family pilus assembly protein [Acidimicrobiales bacterium]
MNKLAILAVAAVVAVVSAFGLIRYVGNAEARAEDTVQPVPVFVATATLAEGTSWDEAYADGRIVATQTMASARPATAVTDPASLTGLVTDGVLLAGQTVVAGTFVDPAAERVGSGPATFADDLPEGTVAVSFEASGAAAVSDLISPGDRVNLLLNVPNASVLGLPDSGGPAVVHVFQDLEVIAIGTAIKPPDGSTEPVANPGAGTYTVAVAPRDAARLLFLTRQYEVLLVLVGPGNEPSEQGPVGATDALPPTLTPVATPAGATTTTTAATDPAASAGAGG